MMGREAGKRIGPYVRCAPRPRGFAAWLDAERIRLDLTIDELAAGAQISRRTLYNVLAGNYPQISNTRERGAR